MAVAVREFERVAVAIAGKTAELLDARVLVTDERGAVVADSAQGRPAPADGERLSVPLHVDRRTGEVVIARRDGGEEISPRLAARVVEMVIDQTTVVDRLPNQHEIKNKFIHDLLRGSLADEAAILREAQVLGMDLAPPRAVILIDAADYLTPAAEQQQPEGELNRRAQTIINSVVGFFMLPSDTICGYIGRGEVAVLKASDTRNLASWANHEDGPDSSSTSWANLAALKRAARALLLRLRSETRAPVNVGIGRYHPGLSGLTTSYEDARAALSLGRRFHGQNQVHCLDGLGIAAFVGVSDERTKVDLATHLLSPLDHWPELPETLRAFFARDCCPSAAARELSIHRNTLGYRLEKIASLTGLDPRRFDDAVQIRLALALKDL